MIGRERELDAIVTAFSDARRNRVPAIARIFGESGIGKTQFLSELASALTDADWLVLQTTSHSIQQKTPFLVSNRLVSAALSRLGPAANRYTGGLEERLANFDASIARFLNLTVPVQSLDAETYSLILLRLFEGIAIDYNVAILCDDAQWMDSDSARALLSLPQKISNGCISVAVAERTDEGTNRSRWLPSIDVWLKPLSTDECRQFVAAELPGLESSMIDAVAHHSGGLPLELVTLCESVRNDRDTNIERSLRGRIAGHLSRLDAGVREFVQLCALLGDPIEYRILTRIYPDLDELERLIARADRYVSRNGYDLAFRHAMLAQSVIGTIAVPVPLHKRIVRALESLDRLELTDYERIAKQAIACGDRELQLDCYRRLAREASLRYAWSVVIDASERMLSLRADDSWRDPEFLLRYIRAMRAYEREPEAVDFLMRELPSVAANGPKGVGLLVAILITMLTELERTPQAIAIYDKYAEKILDPTELCSVVSQTMYAAVMTADDERFSALEAQFDALRKAANNHALSFHAVVQAAYASLNGEADAARSQIVSALAHADTNDPRRRLLLEFASMICDFRNVGCKPLSARLPSLNAAMRVEGDIVYGSICEAWDAFFTGDWDAALRAVAQHYRSQMPVSRAAPLLSVAAAIAALTQADSPFAKEIEATAYAALEGNYRQSAMQLVPWLLLRASDAALEKFAADIAAEIATRPPSFTALGYVPAGFALWATAANDSSILRRIASVEETRDKSAWARAHWKLSRGLALQSLTSASDGKKELSDATDAFRELSAPFFSAFSAHHAGRATPAEKKLLARLGVTSSKTASSKKSVTGLTPREWDVARLVGKGSTNRQVAETLFVSERTVEVHLGNIFGKLGLASRAQLVRWLFENEASA